MLFKEPKIKTRTKGPRPLSDGLDIVMADAAGRRFRLTGYDPERAQYILRDGRAVRRIRREGARWTDERGIVYVRAD